MARASIFVGHRTGSKIATDCAEFLSLLGYAPLLAEIHPAGGDSLPRKIQRLMEKAVAAVVIATPDRSDSTPTQNVTWELGFLQRHFDSGRLIVIKHEEAHITSLMELSPIHFSETTISTIAPMLLRELRAARLYPLLYEDPLRRHVSLFTLEARNLRSAIVRAARNAPNQSRVDIIGISGASCFTDTPSVELLSRGLTHKQWRIRMLLMDPDSTLPALVEPFARRYKLPGVRNKIRTTIDRLLPGLRKDLERADPSGRGTLEVRGYRFLTSLSYMRIGQFASNSLYLSHCPGTDSPGWIINIRSKRAIEQASKHFESIWALSADSVLCKGPVGR